MSHLLPDPETITGFDPRYFDLLPQARMHLGQNRIRLAELKMELERSRNKSHERKLDIIQAEVKELEKEIATLRKRIRQVEHEQEHEIWCGIGAVVEATVSGSWRARGKVEGVTDMYCWIRTDWGRFTCLKSKCIGIYYATKPQAQNYPVDFKRMTQEEQKNLIDPIEKDDENVVIHDRWCEVGAVIKYLVREHNFLIDGKVEGRTEDYLWISTKIGRLIVKKTDCRGHLTKFENQQSSIDPFSKAVAYRLLGCYDVRYGEINKGLKFLLSLLFTRGN